MGHQALAEHKQGEEEEAAGGLGPHLQPVACECECQGRQRPSEGLFRGGEAEQQPQQGTTAEAAQSDQPGHAKGSVRE